MNRYRRLIAPPPPVDPVQANLQANINGLLNAKASWQAWYQAYEPGGAMFASRPTDPTQAAQWDTWHAEQKKTVAGFVAAIDKQLAQLQG